MAESSAAKELAETQLQWGLRIPLRDGVHLNATLYVPITAKSAPALFTLTPYVGQMWHEVAVFFASHGFPFLTVDARGRGNSEGIFRPNIQEAQDGYDVVEWVARQPYCSGQVAMWGGSYGGYAQWATAKERPPHLATIVPVAAPYIGVDFPMRNNIWSPYCMQWLTLVAGRTSQENLFFNSERFWGGQFRRWFESRKAFKELDTFLGVSSATFQEWITHPSRDHYWDCFNPQPDEYSQISIPILSITGCYDGDQLGTLMHYREHVKNAGTAGQAKHFLVIGPWDHAGTRTPQAEFGGLKCGPASLIDLADLHLQWYAWTLQGGPKPEFLQNCVAYYVMGEETWRYADSLEDVTSHHAPLFLHSRLNPTDVYQSGSLAPDMPLESVPDYYRYDPRDVSLAALESTVDPENWTDQRMIHASRGKKLIYHCQPFEEHTEVSGFFKLQAWFSIDRADTDIQASIYEIDIDGSSVLLTTDIVRARYRESLRVESLIRTTEPLRYDLNGFLFVSRCIKPGSRLRLVIGPINSIYSQKNYNAGGVVCDESMSDARPVLVKLFHDATRPSVLYVPIGRADRSDQEDHAR